LDYKGVARLENKILDVKKFPEYFKDVNDFDKENHRLASVQRKEEEELDLKVCQSQALARN
jgi:hypothetical protein